MQSRRSGLDVFALMGSLKHMYNENHGIRFSRKHNELDIYNKFRFCGFGGSLQVVFRFHCSLLDIVLIRSEGLIPGQKLSGPIQSS